MTHEQRLESVRKKIIAKVPEIMELKFGCEVQGSSTMLEYYNEPFVILGGTWMCKKHKKFRAECMDEEDGCSGENGYIVKYGNEEGWGELSLKEPEMGRILGRPICLSHILRAIETTSEKSYYVSSRGKMVEANSTFISAEYDTYRDDLSKQTPQFVEWLNEIIT